MSESAAAAPVRPDVRGFYHEASGSVQYVVAEPSGPFCAIIDPVLDFDPCSGSTATGSADALLGHVHERGLRLAWILDTHPHADHLSAAAYLAGRTGAPTATGRGVLAVQRIWSELYNIPPEARPDAGCWSRLFEDGDSFAIGSMPVRVADAPGHTVASVSYLAGDAAFIHDTLFMPDGGTARADFPGADPAALWRTIQAILALPDDTRLFTGHDYRPGGREPAWESSVRQQREGNVHLVRHPTEEAFLAFRRERDATLPIPRLMLHALQVNIRGGRLPEPEADGRRYLKVPLDRFPGASWG